MSCRDNCSSSVAMRRYDAGHIWRATANDLFVQNRLFCQQQCPPPAIRAPVRDVSNILKTISQWRHATSLHIILANKCTNDTTRGRRPTQIAGTSWAIRRPYRLAFRPPTPFSDAHSNEASADRLIGCGDAVWTAIGDDRPP